MSDLFDSLQTASEFVLLGGMGTLVLVYAFIWIHPVKDAFTAHYRQGVEFIFRPVPGGLDIDDSSSKKDRKSDLWWLRTAVGVAFTAGYLYIAGSLTNATAYWLMEPLHNTELSRFYWTLGQQVPDGCKDAAVTRTSLREWMIPTRVVVNRYGDPCERKTYAATLRDEAVWRTLTPESAEGELGGLVKHIRLARGAAICALAIGLLAFAKIIGAALVFPIASRSEHWGRKWFIALVDYREHTIAMELVRKGTKRAIGIYVGTALLTFLLYAAGVASYMNAEREFHGLAYYGAEAAREKLAAEHPQPAASAADPTTPVASSVSGN